MLEEVDYLDLITLTEYSNQASIAPELHLLANQPIRPNWQVTMPFDVQNPQEPIEVVRHREFLKSYKFVGQQTHQYQTLRYFTLPPLQNYAQFFDNAPENTQQQQTESH